MKKTNEIKLTAGTVAAGMILSLLFAAPVLFVAAIVQL
jgi:hypothetical protein